MKTWRVEAMFWKNKKIFRDKNNECKIQKIFSIQPFLDYERKLEKIKLEKIFLDSSPHRQPAEKGEGVRVENVGRIYSVGKCAVFALCVRTQINVYITGCIVTHPHNKTRLKRFIFVYNGRYTQKRHMNGTGTQQNVYLCNIVTTNLHIYTLKSAKSAVIPLTNPLTLYNSPHYDLHKYTEVKNLLISWKTKSRAKVFTASSVYSENLNSLKSFVSPSLYTGTRAHPIRKLFGFSKFSFAVVVNLKTWFTF